MENNMNEQQEIKEVTIFDEVYKVENLTNRVTQSFVAIQRMDKEAQEANYQSVKAASAVEFQKQQLKTMIEEDKIQSEPKVEAVEEPKK
tara:strand:+ start:396 stop:662 length:267 start_codon:yes stop_codon:yes gene_type:complete